MFYLNLHWDNPKTFVVAPRSSAFHLHLGIPEVPRLASFLILLVLLCSRADPPLLFTYVTLYVPFGLIIYDFVKSIVLNQTMKCH